MNTALYKRNVVTFDSRNRDNYEQQAQVWTPYTLYAAGQYVFAAALGYVCVTGHTSAEVFQNDLLAGYWRQTNVSSPSNYKVRFPAVRMVKAMRLLSSEIPNTQYVINHNNRFLDVSDATYGVDTAVLTLGTYTTSTLADELNRAINVVKGGGAPGSVYSVTYLTTTQRFLITNLTPEPFQLLFKTGPHGTAQLNNNCAAVLGFPTGLDVASASVVRIQSTGIIAPTAAITIDATNHFIDIYDATYGLDTANIPLATYNVTAFAAALDAAINTVKGGGPPGSAYSVYYSNTLNRFVIENVAADAFKLLFKTGPNGSDFLNLTCPTELGFAPALDALSDAGTSLMSSSVINIAGENFCYMVLRGYGAVSTSAKVVDVFAKIVWNVVPRNITFDSFVTNALIFQNARDCIDNFDVAFRNNDGSLYDFNNIDHSFSIEFFCE